MAKNIKSGWKGTRIYPMDPSKVLNKISQSTVESQPTVSHSYNLRGQSQSISTTEHLFNILRDGQSSIDATAFHSTNTALVKLVRMKQPLHTPAQKFVPWLISTAEWLLAENAILTLELKQSKDVLGVRKVREGGK
jgi:hypothetical protein